MNQNKIFFEKVFSQDRMKRYFDLYPHNEQLAISHYECNLLLSESLYLCLSVLEVALRNAIVRELISTSDGENWYSIFYNNPTLANLTNYIEEAKQHITSRHENITDSKIVAELTLGFWVSLMNSEYERVLWRTLRHSFPFMPKHDRQRKNISTPLNTFRRLRNRIFHSESICWNISRVEEIHNQILTVIGWINKDLPKWVVSQEHFSEVCTKIRQCMNWS